jgi:riboflavin kinase/FMN adenylyltransferase
MLNYNYFVYGKVVKGDGRGRKIGYPTANIKPENQNKLIPARGVYLVSSIINKNKYFGMANIGFRPTFTNNSELTSEVHFFDFDKDIYFQDLSIEFLEFIREEKKFESLDKFVNQLYSDKQYCIEKVKMFY